MALATPPKSSPPSDAGRMGRGKCPSRTVSERNGSEEKTVNLQRWEVAGGAFFGLNSLEATKQTGNPIQEEMMSFEC